MKETSSPLGLPGGVWRRPLESHGDGRGCLFELFRSDWPGVPPAVQWTVLRSAAGVMRGVRVHRVHTDYLAVLAGRVSIGLSDLRPNAPATRAAALVNLHADEPTALVVPAGVAHGILSHTRSLIVYATTHYWDEADEQGCRWDDPGLGIAWPVRRVRLSARDAALPSLDALMDDLRGAWQLQPGQ